MMHVTGQQCLKGTNVVQLGESCMNGTIILCVCSHD